MKQKFVNPKVYHNLIKRLRFLLPFVLLSCDLINPSEPNPAYLKIDSVSVSTNYSTQGSASSNNTEAYVFIDGALQGVHDLPILTPILEFGEHRVNIAGGIKRNGLADFRVDYPFYTRFSTEVNFVSGDTVVLDPVLNYTSPLNIFTEDFEDPGIKLIPDFNADTLLQITKDPNEVFERSGSGIITSTEESKFFLFRTDEFFRFPLGQPIFAELNYNSTQDFEVGLVSHYSSGPIATRVVFIRNTFTDNATEWRKIYIDLSTDVNRNSNAFAFDFYISGSSDAVGQKFLFDNLKIVYR